MTTVEIPSGFQTSPNITESLRQLLIAQSLGFSSHRASVNRQLEVLAPISVVDGRNAFHPYINIKGLTCDYNSPESQLLKEMIGADDEVLQDICEVGADTVDLRWKPRSGFNKADFQRALETLEEKIIDVATIEIDSTMVSYWQFKEVENPDYVAGYWTTDDPPVWVPPVGDEFIPADYDDRVPVPFGYNGISALDTDSLLSGAIGEPFQQRTTLGIPKEFDIYRYPEFEMEGTYLTSVVFKNAGGTDITSSYDSLVLQAIVSMILVNGTSFMAGGTLVKKGETLDAVDESYFVEGTQSYTAVILQSFIDDVSDTSWYAYTIGTNDDDRDYPKSEEPSSLYEFYYHPYFATHLWNMRDEFYTMENIEQLSDGLFFYYGGLLYLDSDKFKDIGIYEYSTWITGLAFINVYTDTGGCCGLGGIVGDLLGSIMSFIGIIIEGIADAIAPITILWQKIDGLYWILRGLGFSHEDLKKIYATTDRLFITIVITFFTGGGYSAYQAGASFGSALSTAYTNFATLSGTITSSVGSAVVVAVRVAMVTYSAVMVVEAKNMSVNAESQASQEEEESEDEDTNSMSEDNDYLRELNYNPFARMEYREAMKHESFYSFETKDPYSKILN
ncbi:MAG: hypothetical protein GQ570_08615 [Helicobacteraceae bacterium]|nr:hypothetical protein [Helicobacteraceae bacterium]